jgi:hypothetical protein
MTNDINPQVSEERQDRISSFPGLSTSEIERRQQIEMSFQDVLKTMIEAFKQGSFNVDLRYYKNVQLDNTMFVAAPTEYVDQVLQYSKYDQKLFALFNFGDDVLSFRIGELEKQFLPDLEEFDQTGVSLRGRELIINCTGATNVGGNIKFAAKNIPFSLIFDEIGLMPLDTREAASLGQNAQYVLHTKGDDSLTGKWVMKLFSMGDNANIVGSQSSRTPKITSGGIDFCYNKQTTEVDLFEYSDMKNGTIYYDSEGKKLGRNSRVYVADAKDKRKDFELIKKVCNEFKNQEKDLTKDQFNAIREQLSIICDMATGKYSSSEAQNAEEMDWKSLQSHLKAGDPTR